MDTRPKAFRFVILIPHRDSLKPFSEYRSKLFSIGICGSYAFPAAAPLAALSRPFSREELKELARNIRSLAKESSGKILSAEPAIVACPNGFPASFFGPLLSIPAEEGIFPKTAKHKILYPLLPPVLCAALVGPNENPISEEAPVLSFRAAYLANLAIRPLAGANYSYEWKIGPPVWGIGIRDRGSGIRESGSKAMQISKTL